jgi:hypothetical protein
VYQSLSIVPVGASIGLKYELDALANKDFRYLTKTYLPRKLNAEPRHSRQLHPRSRRLTLLEDRPWPGTGMQDVDRPTQI